MFELIGGGKLRGKWRGGMSVCKRGRKGRWKKERKNLESDFGIIFCNKYVRYFFQIFNHHLILANKVFKS